MSASRLQATLTDSEIRAAASQKDLKDELKDFLDAAETRAAASQNAAETRAAASQKKLKDDLDAAETRAAASQNAAETRAAASQKELKDSFAENLNSNNRKLVPLVVGAAVAVVAFFEWIGVEIVHPWKVKMNK
jgi:hypothetical protein